MRAPSPARSVQRLLDRRDLLRVDAGEVVLAIDAEPQALHSATELRDRAHHCISKRRGILRIVAGDGVVHHGDVAHRARHRPDVIQRLGQRQHAEAADPPIGGLQPDEPVGAGGKADRSAGVRADRGVAEARRGGHARATGRQTRPLRRVPGIDGDAHVGVIAGHRAFGEIQLAEDHGSRAPQLRDHRAIHIGHEVLQHRRPAHRRHALRVAEVLHRHGHAVQRSAIPACHYLLLGGTCIGQRLRRHHGGVAVQTGVQPADAREHALGDHHRRELLRGDATSDLLKAQVMQRLGCRWRSRGTGPSRGGLGQVRVRSRRRRRVAARTQRRERARAEQRQCPASRDHGGCAHCVDTFRAGCHAGVPSSH